jgi:AraC-like DNA-binding protein
LQWIPNRLLQDVFSATTGAVFASQQYSQLLFVEALRIHLASNDSLPPSWLKALADERLGPAVGLIHADPTRSWQLGELARAAAMSCSAFAERFTSVAGMPALTYLRVWRMMLAERVLREQDTSIVNRNEVRTSPATAPSTKTARVSGGSLCSTTTLTPR